jgi:catechol 2,3-dioxygenase-like lactoylglutathione lyase family enzyme
MLQHVALETRREDADAVLAFLALIGFDAVDPPPGLRDSTRWAQRGRTQIHLLLTDAPVVPPWGHAAVVVEDYDETLARLRAAGHPVEPRPEQWGAPRAFATDPAGHIIEVMSVPPPG